MTILYWKTETSCLIWVRTCQLEALLLFKVGISRGLNQKVTMQSPPGESHGLRKRKRPVLGKKGKKKNPHPHPHPHPQRGMKPLGRGFAKSATRCLPDIFQTNTDKDERPFFSTKEIHEIEFHILVSLWIKSSWNFPPKSAIKKIHPMETAKNFLLSNNKSIRWLISSERTHESYLEVLL